MKSKLERIVAHCKSSVTVTANDHTTSYESMSDYLNNRHGEPITEVATLSVSQKDIVERCIKASAVWEVQAYDRTPVGFYLTIGSTMDEALDVMLEVLGLEAEEETDVDTLKARIVELEHQSVKALEGLMKANDRLLASAELKRWGDEKPEQGSSFLIYYQGHAFPQPSRWGDGDDRVRGGQRIVTSNGVWPQPDDSARWCYVPSSPDWDRIK